MKEPNPIETSTSRERETEVVIEPRSQVEITMERELVELAGMLSRRCIYRVPEVLCTLNREAYAPKVISIGPYHYKRNNLQNMHFYKMKFVQCYIDRPQVKLGKYVKIAQDLEREVREQYDGGIALDSDEFVQMILMDGIFLVEFMRQYLESLLADKPIIDFREYDWDNSLIDDIIHDLMSLENQLPFSFLMRLIDAYPDHPNPTFSWDDCIRTFLSGHYEISKIFSRYEEILSSLHLVDIQHAHFTTSGMQRPKLLEQMNIVKGQKIELLRSATELQEAGVKIKNLEDVTLTKVRFTDGELQIIPIVVTRNAESLFRNIIAFEQCHRKGNIFRSYVIFMDCLINTSDDVDLLVELGIIKNSLGDSEDVCTLFNNLYKITMMEGSEFYYGDVCRELNAYSRNWWHQWKAAWFRAKIILRRNYFGSPWTIISVIAAFVLLVVTIIQTLCSIKATNW